MSHYAKIDEFNIIQEVIVAEYDQILSGAFGDPNTWIRTSRNTIMGQHISGGKPFRKKLCWSRIYMGSSTRCIYSS